MVPDSPPSGRSTLRMLHHSTPDSIEDGLQALRRGSDEAAPYTIGD
ncbi:MAG: hypothetical protein ABIP77_09510 [Candidatus Limnocylindrales bacterium]